MPVCRYCNKREASVRAHIIPRSFFVAHQEESGPAQIISTARDHYPKRSPIGEYDSNILCAECESTFSEYDDYGYRFFHDREEIETLYPGTEGEAYRLPSVDYAKLKLFLLSVLWRASVSERDFYNRVSLGPYEKVILECLRDQDPKLSQEFAVIFQIYDYESALVPILAPMRIQLENVNFYQLILNGFNVWMKVDKRPVPKPFDELALSPDRPLIVLPREFIGSKEREIMLRAANSVRTT